MQIDEMYAAIEDPNNIQVDLYTSGSETYAQIQQPIIDLTAVSNEINITPLNPTIKNQDEKNEESGKIKFF